MLEKAYITPEVLRWARDSAKVSLEKAASTISQSCSISRIIEWESPSCKDFPTIKQVEKLARLYRRPLAVFFLPKIPRDFQTLRDFRKARKGDFSTALIFMMRELQEKQDWLRTLYEEAGEHKIGFVGLHKVTDSVETVAESILNTFEINETSEKLDLREWIDRIERKRIFISLSSNFHTRLMLDCEEVKGFAIADQFAPFIFLNSNDWKNAQLFTLVHELVHICINESGISNETGIYLRDNSNNDPIEIFCNRVAASVLLPEKEVRNYLSILDEITYAEVNKMSKRFRVSNVTLLIRLLNLGIISKYLYETLRKIADSEFKDFILKNSEKEKEGFANPYIMWVRRNGKAFSQIVFDQYKGGAISGLEASHLLNVKINNFPKLEHYIYK